MLLIYPLARRMDKQQLHHYKSDTRVNRAFNGLTDLRKIKDCKSIKKNITVRKRLIELLVLEKVPYN